MARLTLSGRAAPFALAGPAIALLFLFFVAPLALFILYSLYRGGFYQIDHELTLDNYTRVVKDSFARELAGNAFLIGAITGLIAVALGLPFAYFIRYCAGRLEYPILVSVVIALLLSYLVRIYAWRTILGETGLLAQTLDAVGIAGIGSILYSRGAVIIALVNVYLPFVALVAYAAFRNIPHALFELSADLGAGGRAKWRRVVLPLIAPAAATGFLYTFVLSASDYVTPQFLGGSSGNMIGLYIQVQFTQLGNYPFGAALSVVLLGCFLLTYALVGAALRALRVNRNAVRS